MSDYTIGSFLFDYLHRKGVEHVFGLPGDFALPTFRWLEKSKLEIITLTHEPSVGFAADVYARSHGLGVACVTYCVGGLNMLNPVACAYAEKSPLLVISGGPSPTDRRNDALVHHKVRTFDTQRRIYEEVTCANAVLDNPETAASEIIRVVETMLEHSRPGYIEVPYDMVDKVIPILPSKARIAPHSDPETLEACIAEAADMINKARQPVILAGVELHRHGLTDKVVALAQKFNLPIAATLDSKGVISESNPLYMGVYSHALSDPKCEEYVNASDCLIMLGTFISDVFFGFGTQNLSRKNSILVTTEKARVQYHSFDDVLFSDFLDGLGKADIKTRKFTNPNPYEPPLPIGKEELGETLKVDTMFRALAQSMPEGSTIICDVGESLFGAIGLRTTKRHRFFADAYYLSMGFAMPAAIGALARHDEELGRTFVIIGDGAFQMTGTEFSTAVKYGMNPIVIVMNNDGYGTQRHIIDGPFNNLQRWQYHKMTDMVGGGMGLKAETPQQMLNALQQAIANKDQATLIEAMIPRDDCSTTLRRLGESLASQRDVNKRKK